MRVTCLLLRSEFRFIGHTCCRGFPIESSGCSRFTRWTLVVELKPSNLFVREIEGKEASLRISVDRDWHVAVWHYRVFRCRMFHLFFCLFLMVHWSMPRLENRCISISKECRVRENLFISLDSFSVHSIECIKNISIFLDSTCLFVIRWKMTSYNRSISLSTIHRIPSYRTKKKIFIHYLVENQEQFHC